MKIEVLGDVDTHSGLKVRSVAFHRAGVCSVNVDEVGFVEHRQLHSVSET